MQESIPGDVDSASRAGGQSPRPGLPLGWGLPNNFHSVMLKSPVLCTLELDLLPTSKRRKREEKKTSSLKKKWNGPHNRKGSTHDCKIIVFSNQSKLVLQISSPNCDCTVAWLHSAEKVVFTEKKAPSNRRLPHFPLLQIWEMWLICIFNIHLHSAFNSP